MNRITVSEFVHDNNGYKAYWKHENENKNAICPEEGLKVVVRKIMMAAKVLNISTETPTLTRDLSAKVGTYHVSGEASVQDTVKSVASTYKRQPETCLLKGDGAFPTSPSNKGAAARYTQVLATPLGKQVFRDIDYCNWIIDDSGVEQVDTIVMPMPMALLTNFKGIGVGRATFYCERPHDQVYDWSRKIIDIAYPDKEGSHWSERYLKAVKGKTFESAKDIREFRHKSLVHDDIKDEDKIAKIDPPKPFNFNGAICEFSINNNGEKKIMMFPKIEKETGNNTAHYYITALPLETSDKIVLANIEKKYGKATADKCTDLSGDGNAVKLEIPRSIANDESCWFALKMKKGFTENYGIWENDTVHFIENLYPIVIKWYQKREEVVSRRLYHSIAKDEKELYLNNLIKQYYDYKEAGKIKNEDDVTKLFGEDDAKILINMPEKNFIKANVDKLMEKNKIIEKKIKETKNDILNIKDYIFNEWKAIAEANKKFVEED